MDESVPSNLHELYKMKLIVLLECKDGNFRQVVFTRSQFNDIADFIFQKAGKGNPFGQFHGLDTFGIQLNNDWTMPSDSFLGLEDHYGESID